MSPSVPPPSSSAPLNPLARAHALSAQASIVLRAPQPSLDALKQALQAYNEAAELYESAADGSSGGGAAGQEGGGDATGNTLKLLTAQHRRLAKDVERRIASASPLSPAFAPRQATTSGSAQSKVDEAAIADRRPHAGTAAYRPTQPLPPIRRATDGYGIGLGAAGSLGNSPWQAAGIASRLSPPRNIPPFALRPPIAGVPPPNPFPTDSLSPLHSSSSSSDTAPEESFVHFGGAPDTLDPFSRFWGMLENMIEDISNPVAFASAPLDLPPAATGTAVADGSSRKVKKEHKDKDKAGKNRTSREERKRDSSSTESFYVVQKGKEEANDDDDSDFKSSSAGPSAKTPEELALENTSLRSSLDAFASHFQALETTNRQLRAALEDRDSKLKVAIVGVRREALKAKEGQREMLRSGMLASVASVASVASGSSPARVVATTHASPRPTTSSIPAGPSATADRVGLVGAEGPGAVKDKDGSSTNPQRRIKELEDEVSSLKLDNARQRAHVEKYKERFGQLKASARAKKEAKLAAASLSGTAGASTASVDRSKERGVD